MKHTRYQFYCGIITAVLIAVLPARAETLQEAWKTALTLDHTLKASEQNTAAAAQQVNAAKAARLPSLNLNAGYNVLNAEPGVEATFGGSTTSFPTTQKSTLSYKVSTQIPLYTSGRITSGINSAEASLKAARSDEAGRALDIKLRVAQAYVNILRAQKNLEVAKSHVASLESHARDVENLYEQDMVARNDLLSAKVTLADARQKAIQVQNSLEIAGAAYNRLLGRDLSYKISPDELAPEPVNDSLHDLTAQALDQRTELAVLEEQIRSTRQRASGIRAGTGPQLALTGGYEFRQNRHQVHEGLWSATMGLQWNLFDGGVARHRASAVENQAKALEEQRKDSITAIDLQVRQAWLDVQETRKRIKVTQEAVAQAEENLKVNTDRYHESLATNTEVLDAETLRTRSQNNHANAVYDAVLAVLRLKRAVGSL